MSADKKESTSSSKLKQTTMGNYLTSDRKTRSSRHNWGDSELGSKFTSIFFANASKRDTEQYRKGYPGKKDNPKQNDNLLFYTNQMESYPNGDFIDNIHKKWWADYSRLEIHHGYIQWIFPIRESGMNWHAQELQLHEAKAIMADPKAKRRLLNSYKMMLDFYGMELENDETGHIIRADNSRERFKHLNRSYHNYLRITRMLKSLGELGYEHLKKPFVEFVLEEALEKDTLKNCLESCCKYWLETIKDDKARESLQDYVCKMDAGYGTKYPPGGAGYGSDDDMEDTERYGSDTLDLDENSQEARHWQEEEDRLIAMNEQFKEDMLSKSDEVTEENMDVDNNVTEEKTNDGKDQVKLDVKADGINPEKENNCDTSKESTQKNSNNKTKDKEMVGDDIQKSNNNKTGENDDDFNLDLV